MKKKKFRLFDAVLMAVVVILVVESAAPAAVIGSSQFFWWGVVLLLFFLPYGLISAELGTSYEGEGGLYDWVTKAFGHKWGARAAWFYWINFPLWMASLAVLFTEVMSQIFQLELSVPVVLLIELAFIWIVTFISCYPVSESKWILNLAAIAKFIIMISLGILGIYHAVTVGIANDFSGTALLPKLEVQSLSFISVILFNFLGFEVVTTMASDMDNPKKQIPQAIIYGGILITFFYLFATFGIGVAVPVEQLSTSSGLIDSFILFFSGLHPFVIAIGVLFMYTLFANLISWSFGINYVASYAAKNNDLPRVFAKENPKNNMPTGATVLNGVIASLLVVIAPFIPNQNIFLSFFSLNVIALLISYILMFPAFLKLRRIDKDHVRPFKIPGPKLLITCITVIPVVLLVITLIFTIVPLNGSEEELATKMPMLAGTVIITIVGEIIIYFSKKKEIVERSFTDENN